MTPDEARREVEALPTFAYRHAGIVDTYVERAAVLAILDRLPAASEPGRDGLRNPAPNVSECTCDRDDDSWVGEPVDMPLCPYHEKRLRHLSWESLACMVIDYEAALAALPEAAGTGLDERLRAWIAKQRATEWTGPVSLTAEDAYKTALEEVEALL